MSPTRSGPTTSDFVAAIRAAMADPEGLDALETELIGRVSGTIPTATQVRVGDPLPPRTIPTKYDFCTSCGIDVFSNPEVRVTGLEPEDVVLVCDCGHTSRLPKWLFP